MKSRPVWLVIVAMLLGASSAFAQMTQGRLTGTVTDSQGAVMPGVTVTVTSPALIGSQNTVTEANGRYLFPSLPSGIYNVCRQGERVSNERFMRAADWQPGVQS